MTSAPARPRPRYQARRSALDARIAFLEAEIPRHKRRTEIRIRYERELKELRLERMRRVYGLRKPRRPRRDPRGTIENHAPGEA